VNLSASRDILRYLMFYKISHKDYKISYKLYYRRYLIYYILAVKYGDLSVI